MKKLSIDDHATEMAIARSNLNALYAIIAICDGGVFSNRKVGRDFYPTTSQIIRLCKGRASVELEAYDAHRAAIRKAKGEA
jgi:uncharacterized phage protein gp47/JayE